MSCYCFVSGFILSFGAVNLGSCRKNLNKPCFCFCVFAVKRTTGWLTGLKVVDSVAALGRRISSKACQYFFGIQTKVGFVAY